MLPPIVESPMDEPSTDERVDDDPTSTSLGAAHDALRGILDEDDADYLLWRREGVPIETIAKWLRVSRDELRDRAERVRRIVQRLASIGGVPQRTVTLSEARDLVTAFVHSAPSTERVAVASVLQSFAAANQFTSVASAVQKFANATLAVSAEMSNRFATALRAAGGSPKDVNERRRVLAAHTTFARQHGYLAS
jgi:hypothetical protein